MSTGLNSIYFRYQSGMTLLEVLIALVIFIIIAAAGYGGLQQGIAVQQQLQQKQQFWRRLDAVMMMLEQDLDQARNLSPRIPVWDAVSFRGYSNQNAEALGELIKFTRVGDHSFRAGIVSPYQRLAYRLRDGVLYRASWGGLNLPETEQGVESEVLAGVSEIELRYLQENRRWVERWPLRFTPEESASVPRAVELTLTLVNATTYKRVFNVGALR
jgi:general secretion pathway protein J